MARTDHYIGLNAWAHKLVNQTITVTERGTRTYPCGKEESFERQVEVPLVKAEKVGEVYGLCSSFDLLRYTLPNGRVVEEYLQAQPWSSGPYHFIALRETARNIFGREFQREIPESLWTDEEIEGV